MVFVRLERSFVSYTLPQRKVAEVIYLESKILIRGLLKIFLVTLAPLLTSPSGSQAVQVSDASDGGLGRHVLMSETRSCRWW